MNQPHAPIRRRRKRSRAFTLPEVLATLVITGVILPVAMRGLSVCLRASAGARQQLEAGQLAQQKLNEILVTRDQTSFQSSGDFGADWPDYHWETQGQLVAYTTYQVTCIVTWTAQGTPRSLSMSTLVYPPNTSSSSSSSSSSTGGGT